MEMSPSNTPFRVCCKEVEVFVTQNIFEFEMNVAGRGSQILDHLYPTNT